ncbi:MAG: right-handed parallel beta-helix repeat-containing protein [Candidatus Bathyarchaeota archaeon]|nr:right-handed parallel beta-helix repeat-containing protein [Candidatus Bathyarchaeum sp.]
MKTVPTTILLMILFIGTLTMCFNFTSASSEPKTITVPDDYEKIQDAINAANSGDTILVKAGTYNEELITVNKSVSLVGDEQKSLLYYHSVLGFLVTSNNVHITGFTITNSEELQGYAVSLANVSDCVIENNSIKNNLVGITVYGRSSGNTVSGNILDDNERSIELIDALDNIISENSITGATVSGISLDLSSGNTVSKNMISDITDEFGALMLWSSPNNTVYRNILNKGTLLIFGSQSNMVTENFVINSEQGVLIGESSGNTIYRNYFINVTELVSDTEALTGQLSQNSWDNGVEGNYWSNYAGADANGDGIGDYSQVLYEGNQDNYPLMDYPEVSINPETEQPQTEGSSSASSALPTEAVYLILVVILIIVAAVAVIKLKKR